MTTEIIDVQKQEELPAECCASCRFAFPTPKMDGRVLCRRFPPTINSFLLGFHDNQVSNPNYSHTVAFPVTANADWCGEHQPLLIASSLN